MALEGYYDHLDRVYVSKEDVLRKRIKRITGEENREYLLSMKLQMQEEYLASIKSKEKYLRQAADLKKEYGTGVRPGWVSAELSRIYEMATLHEQTTKEYENIVRQVKET